MFEDFQKSLEQITSVYTVGDFYREVYGAKKAYFTELGDVPEDDPDFENQMELFMGWYLFDRPLTGFDLPPVQLYFRKNKDGFPEDLKKRFELLTQARVSVFDLVKIRDDRITLRDLSNGEKVDVEEVKDMLGFSRGDLFEARLIPTGMGPKYVFSKGFRFHPREAVKFIESQMKKIRKEDHAQRTKLLLKLGQMRTKTQRFPHISPEHIYSLSPVF